MSSLRSALRRRDGELADDLMNAGFSIAALDVMGGRRSPEWALEHVRTCLPKRNERGREMARALLIKWEGSPRV